MDWDNESWFPWYRRQTAGWRLMSMQARGLLVSITMELNPKTGTLVLRRGLASLGTILGSSWVDIEPVFAELIALGKLEWDGALFVLSDPEFVSRIRRPASTERVREFRKRQAMTHETDETLHAFHETNVTRREEKRSEEIKIDKAADASSDPVTRVQRKIGSRLPADWKPSEATLEWAREQGFRNPLGPLAEFRDYWVGIAGSRGTKLDWDATYRNRLRQIIGRGETGSSPADKPSREETKQSAKEFAQKLARIANGT